MAVLPLMVLAMIEAGLVMTLLYPVLLLLPKNHVWRVDPRARPGSLLFFMAGTGCRYVKRHSMGWRALEYLYDWDISTKTLRGLDRLISNIWNQLENVRATRNRLRNVRAQLFKETDRIIQNKGAVTIVSLAAGSARGPIEVLATILALNPHLLEHIRLVVIDDDPDAFAFCTELAQNLYPGLETRLVCERRRISRKPDPLASLADFIGQFSPDIIEMVGFTDYMPQDKCVPVFNMIRSCLAPGGVFVTNNVTPNFEQTFLELVVTWHMLNRSEPQMRTIFASSGFTNIETVWEPTGIQPLYVVRT